jgi:hypothetical protein
MSRLNEMKTMQKQCDTLPRSFHSTQNPFLLDLLTSMRVGNDRGATTSSGHRTTVVVDPGVIRQLTLPGGFKLTLYEEGRRELRCERTFLHICRVCCEVIEDTQNLIAFSNPGFFFSKFDHPFLRGFFSSSNSSWNTTWGEDYISNIQNYLY